MRQQKWSIGKRKLRVVPVGEGFTGKDKEDNLNKFFASPEYKKLWDRLEETKQRLPWIHTTIDSLKAYIEQTGTLTDKQKSFATSLYIDACVTSDDRLFEQVEARKLGYRLMNLELGRVKGFVSDIMYKTNNRPFSLGQIRALNNIAKQQRVKLTQIPKLIDGVDFDGWFLTETDKVEVAYEMSSNFL